MFWGWLLFTIFADKSWDVDINSINEFIYVPESKDDNNLDVSINGENDIPSGSAVLLEDNASVTHENVPFLPVSNENSKMNVIQQIIIPKPIDKAASEDQLNQEEHVMEPSNSLLLVTKKGKPRKRRTLSTPLDARKKPKKMKNEKNITLNLHVQSTVEDNVSRIKLRIGRFR